MASNQGDMDQLRTAIAALGQPKKLQLRADRQELVGHLALAEQNWDAAIEAFDGATHLRREALDYRGMVKALALTVLIINLCASNHSALIFPQSVPLKRKRLLQTS